jgi:deazaflavin-dependent oxidoreductase (nitroreductase family)
MNKSLEPLKGNYDMSNSLTTIEKTVFRRINALVEPAVRKGFGSPTFTPASLIVLETIGFKSGAQRRTPLWTIRLGRYRVVSTARGDRSFWVKNLLKQPKVSYYVGGKRRHTDAVVFASGATQRQLSELPGVMKGLSKLFSKYSEKGWAFAILVPARA